MISTILVVDDEEQMRSAMELALTRAGYEVVLAEDGKVALDLLLSRPVHVIVSDLRMPNLSGEQFMAEACNKYSSIPFIVVTAFGTISQAVEAMRMGAFDFITKPFSAEDLESVVERALAMNKPHKKRAHAIKDAYSKDSRSIITNDKDFVKLIEITTTIAPSNASVMIEGESGTGKELISRLIHNASLRTNGPFVAVNCAALPANLLESELFGYEKGSFTGALASKPGKFELANGGTILLDEISEMDITLQAKLLRVLQEREVDRIGGLKPVPIDVRVICTTNRDLLAAVKKGSFREDLYYRLNVIPLKIPPLRKRPTDIRLLLEHFLRKFSCGRKLMITPHLLDQLSLYKWPGNVRELENACERAVLLASGDVLEVSNFLVPYTALTDCITSNAVADYPQERTNDDLLLYPGLSVAEAERRLIEETLRSTENNKTKAADLLGISVRTLRNKLNEYGVDS